MRYKGKVECLIVFIILLILIMSSTFRVFAATSSSDLNQKINNAKNEQAEIRGQMSSIQKEVEDLNSKITNYENEIIDLGNQVEDIEKNIEEAQNKINETQKDLEEKEELLEKRLVASYKAGETTYLDVLLSSDSLTSFLSNYYLMEQLAQYDNELIETVKQTKEQIEESKKILEDSKVKIEDIKKSEESKKAELSVAKSEKTQKVNNLSVEDKQLQKQIEEMQAEDARIRAAIKQAEAEAERRKQQQQQQQNNNNNNTQNNSNTGSNNGTSNGGNNSNNSNSSGGSSNTSSGNNSSSNSSGFIWPVPAAYKTITTGLYYSSGAYHGAVDFGTSGINGQPVYAVKSGRVVLAVALTYSYGNYVLLDHEDGTYTLYAHGQAGSICVSQGQTVAQGQQLMRVGNTGNSFGAHLHFEVRLSPGGYNNRVDPRKYLPK